MNFERKQARKANRQRKEVARTKRKTLEKAAPDLLEALKRAYFLIETHNIKDAYFEALRRKIIGFLPSQVVDIKLLAEAIEQNSG